jgi:DNA-3-methyladenine glycosylase
VLPAAFYARPVDAVARDLLGRVVVHAVDGTVRAGRIVETEAYAGGDDPASHAWGGPGPHRRHLFGRPGTVYVYRSYGVHWCVNAVTAPDGGGCAVLLRALEPLDGLDAMGRDGAGRPVRQLAAGPGRLCQVMAITGAHDGGRWWRGPLFVLAGTPVPEAAVAVTPRIGIRHAADRLLRFVVRDSASLSRRMTTV